MDAEGSRAAVLAKIRARVAIGDEAIRRSIVERRLANPKPNLVPARGEGDQAHRIALFTRLMEGVGGSVEAVPQMEDVPQAVAAYLRSGNYPARIRHGAEPKLAGLPWHQVPTLEVAQGRARPEDHASLSLAFAGVAESATLILTSGPDNPTTLNFLPAAHIVVLEASRLAGSYEEVWPALRAKFGQGIMPRTVNMISGPSRTGDIEQTIVRPAHGPKHLHVIIVA